MRFRHPIASAAQRAPTGCRKNRFCPTPPGRRLNLPLYANRMMTSPPPIRWDSSVTGSDTVWNDGPLTLAVREGGIYYLDDD